MDLKKKKLIEAELKARKKMLEEIKKFKNKNKTKFKGIKYHESQKYLEKWI